MYMHISQNIQQGKHKLVMHMNKIYEFEIAIPF